MTNETTSTELAQTLTEMLAHLNKVATMVSKVFPDESIGQSIKDCGEKLKQHIDLLVVKASGIDVLDDIDPTTKMDEINTLVMDECITKLKKMKATPHLDPSSEYREEQYLLGLLHYLKK